MSEMFLMSAVRLKQDIQHCIVLILLLVPSLVCASSFLNYSNLTFTFHLIKVFT